MTGARFATVEMMHGRLGKSWGKSTRERRLEMAKKGGVLGAEMSLASASSYTSGLSTHRCGAVRTARL